jgi:Copper type II ascorbate-dependent monooxygenase, C-terminal domain
MAKRSGSPFSVLFLSLVLAVAASACGGDDDDTGGGVDGGDGGGVDAGAGGGDDDDGSGGGECAEEPCLEAPEEGFQVRSTGTEIEPGEDVEYCEVVQLPGGPDDTYYVNRFESEMTLGSHHLIVQAIVPGSTMDANAQVGDRVPCFGPGGFEGEAGDLLDVTGQQVPYHEENFPAGVGRIYTGGQKVIFNYHYFNATDNPLEARAAVNFFTTDEANVQKIAESYGAIFVGINVGIGETESYDLECMMDIDVMVHKLTRHTHKWGTDFPVSFAGGERDGELIYTSPNYEQPDHIFEEPVLVRAGEGFRFTCNYDNTDGDHVLTFGEKTTNEMCILFATVFSPDGREVNPDQGCLLFSE